MVKQSVGRDSVIEPRQQRSRDTLARLLQATRELLAESVFEDISVVQIASRAGCSVGTFYERFANKDAVLPHLLKIHYEEMERELDRTLAAEPKRQAKLGDRVREVIRLLVDVARKERGLIRTLVLRNNRRPESIPPSIRDSAERILGAIYRFLLECRSEIRHPEPETALSVGLLMTVSAIRERIVFAGTAQASTLSITSDAFAAELSHALLAYLRSPTQL